MEVVSHAFRVMASDAIVTLVAPRPGTIERAEARLRLLETRWSRFLDDSDISRLNRTPDRWVPVSEDTIRLVRTMQAAARSTGGSYDPTFLHHLLELGYSTSVDDPPRVAVTVDRPCGDRTVHDAELDVRASAARLPQGLALDPGGIGKGLAADLVATEVVRSGTAGVLVSVGGDIAAHGTPPASHGWVVEVEDPHDARRLLTTLAVSGGGIATSSTLSRRWTRSGRERHHVIDPATGTCSRTDLAAATVVAPAGWLAESHATAALLRGSGGAIDYLEDHGLTGIVTTSDRSTSTTSDLAFAEPHPILR